MKKAAGGSVAPSKVPADERTNSMVKREMEGHKRGGEVKGAMPKHRLDKRARGGRMTPKSPLSGAGDMKRMPYEGTMDHQDEGGKGPTVRP
jgi:hypothetical protein